MSQKDNAVNLKTNSIRNRKIRMLERRINDQCEDFDKDLETYTQQIVDLKIKLIEVTKRAEKSEIAIQQQKEQMLKLEAENKTYRQANLQIQAEEARPHLEIDETLRLEPEDAEVVPPPTGSLQNN